MKSELSQILKREFHKKMTVDMPLYRKIGTAFGGIVYRGPKTGSGRYPFVFMMPASKADRFTLELGASTTPDFPFHILPGETDSSGAVRYRIRHFLKSKLDVWWNLNDSHLPDFESILKTFEPEEIQRATGRIPALVQSAYQSLQAVLPIFLATL